jgi:hypothetical protein
MTGEHEIVWVENVYKADLAAGEVRFINGIERPTGNRSIFHGAAYARGNGWYLQEARRYKVREDWID